MPISMCAIGDNVIDRYPEEGLAFPGGSATNAAVFASRLGAAASYIGVVGSDRAAAFLLARLEAEGVDTTRVTRGDEPNPTTDVLVDKDGNRRFTSHRPPTTTLMLTDDDLDFLRGMDWVHTGHSSYIEHELRRLKDVAPISFDFSYQGLDYANEILPNVEFATFSRDGLPLDDCVALLRVATGLGARFALVTRGAAGAVAMSSGEVFEQAAVPTSAVDTIGAGDAFQTALIAELMRGEGVEKALSAASAFAAEVCGYRGAFGYQTDLSELFPLEAERDDAQRVGVDGGI